MTSPSLSTLLLGVSTLALASLAAPAFAASGAEVTSADDQSTTADQAGQANDKNSLTTADIIVTGSRTAEAAPITSSLTTTQPQSAVSRSIAPSRGQRCE